MASVNEEIADRIRIHALDFERFAAGLRRRVLELLLALEADLIAQLRALDPTEPAVREFREARLERLLEQTRASIAEGYAAVNGVVLDDLGEVAEIAAVGAAAAVNEVVGASIMTAALAPERARALVDETMIEGAPSADWWAKQAGDAVFRFRAAVQMGYAQGETVEQIVRRVKGTRAAGYRDGVMEVTRRNATSLVHTSVQAVSNSARREAFANNSDIIYAKLHISTLDSSTTPVCRARSGLAWTLDGKPIRHNIAYNGGPPLHFRCRSTEVPLLKDIDDIPNGKAARIDEATQASMDGQVPADLDFENWLKTKSKTMQVEILGPGRWELWNAGKITMVDMVDQTGRELTLEELRKKFGL
jgi:SPP1 gp7 family putative phage head morphogenesis protein